MNQHLIYLQVPATPLTFTSYWNSTKWLLNNSYKYTGVIRAHSVEIYWFFFRFCENTSIYEIHSLKAIQNKTFDVRNSPKLISRKIWRNFHTVRLQHTKKKNTSSGHFAGSNKSITAALLLNTSLAVHVFTQYILMDENYSVIPIKYILEYLYQAM